MATVLAADYRGIRGRTGDSSHDATAIVWAREDENLAQGGSGGVGTRGRIVDKKNELNHST